MTTTAPETAGAVTKPLEDGRVVAIAGPVVDVEFPPHALPEINHAVEMDLELEGEKVTVVGRGGPADRRGPGALHLHAADRRPGPRGRRCATPAGASRCPVGDVVLGHVFNVLGEPLDTDDIGAGRRPLGDPPAARRTSTSSSPGP